LVLLLGAVLVLLMIIMIIAAISLLMNAGYIVHELGWYPHTKDRTSPAEEAFSFQSRYETDVAVTHRFQVMESNTELLRRHGHADVYRVSDPHQALENVIDRYNAEPTRSRYDDLVNVSNYVCNRVLCDERVNDLITDIVSVMHSTPYRDS
jgi:hypothetical protein